jgi:hypothetical protein
MRLICLLKGWFLFLSISAHAGHTPPKIFLRVFVQTAGEGLPETQATSISIPPDGEIIQIRALPEVTERELIGVQQDASGAIHLQFNHEGIVVINAFTAQNQGRIMVLMINGIVVYAPLIDEQISTGELIIPSSHPLKPEAVQLLQETAAKNVKEHART